ncbi:hypothetical protein Fmac_020248 [Flemingia macrophylla]|uniref:Maturase K n=1 Tax=Flemingia macrophylla TaxID=520843 RepID=A0ABD1LTH4_9FABA
MDGAVRGMGKSKHFDGFIKKYRHYSASEWIHEFFDEIFGQVNYSSKRSALKLLFF